MITNRPSIQVDTGNGVVPAGRKVDACEMPAATFSPVPAWVSSGVPAHPSASRPERERRAVPEDEPRTARFRRYGSGRLVLFPSASVPTRLRNLGVCFLALQSTRHCRRRSRFVRLKC